MKNCNDNDNIKIAFFVIIGGVCLIISIIARYIQNNVVEHNNSKYSSLTYITKESSINQPAYLYIDNPYIIVQDNNNAFLIVNNKNRMYIVYTKVEDYEKLLKIDLNKKPTKLIGIVKKVDNYLISQVLNNYNDIEDPEAMMNYEDFSEYFGEFYLDTLDYDGKSIIKDSDLKRVHGIIFWIFFIVGILCEFLGFRYYKQMNDY